MSRKDDFADDLDSDNFVHSSQGFREPIRRFKAKNYCPKPPGVLDDEKRGFAHENKFEVYVEELRRRRFLPWIMRLRKASWNEDNKHEIDFKLELRFPRLMEQRTKIVAIQIKSSLRAVRDFTREHPDRDVRALVVNEKTTLDHVRRALRAVYFYEFRHLPLSELEDALNKLK